MTSFVSNVLNGLRRITENSLQQEPAEGIGRRLVAGWSMVLISSVGVAFLGLVLGLNSLPFVVTTLVGSSALLRGAGDLAFNHQRRLARRLRVLATVSLALAALALATMVFQMIFLF